IGCALWRCTSGWKEWIFFVCKLKVESFAANIQKNKSLFIFFVKKFLKGIVYALQILFNSR
ncbi:MAG: hypothetical protein ACOCNX_09710, partial [Prevotella sp.]